MLPLSFTDLADSPTIVISPHQHQFDPIASRAAHSIYYHQQSHKPLMPTRHWDHPLIMSKAIPAKANPARKRNLSEHEDDEEMPAPNHACFASKTPKNSPTNVNPAQSASLGEAMERARALEQTMNRDVPRTGLDAVNSALLSDADDEVEHTSSDLKKKRVRMVVGGETVSSSAPLDSSHGYNSGPAPSGTVHSDLNAYESNDYWAGDASSDMAARPANLQNPDGSWPGSSNQNQDHGLGMVRPRTPRKEFDHDNGSGSGDEMDVQNQTPQDVSHFQSSHSLAYDPRNEPQHHNRPGLGTQMDIQNPNPQHAPHLTSSHAHSSAYLPPSAESHHDTGSGAGDQMDMD